MLFKHAIELFKPEFESKNFRLWNISHKLILNYTILAITEKKIYPALRATNYILSHGILDEEEAGIYRIKKFLLVLQEIGFLVFA